jgi:hypothetical protein
MKLFLTCLLFFVAKTQTNSFTYEDVIGNKITIEGELPEKIDSTFLKSELNSTCFLGNDYPKTNYHIYISKIKKIKKDIYYLNSIIKTVKENNNEELILEDISRSVYEIKTVKVDGQLKIQTVNYQYSENAKGNYVRLPQLINTVKK